MSSTEAWIDFWFKPYLYMHRSWMSHIDQRLLTEASSSLAWQGSYPYLCQVLGMRSEYQELNSEFISSLSQEFLKSDFQLLDIASFMITGTFKLEDIDVNQKRLLVQRSRALSLKKRLYDPIQGLSEIDAGLILIYLLCLVVDPHSWQRIRLFFDKNRVIFIEQSAAIIELTDITRRSIIRACNEIFQLRNPPALTSTDQSSSMELGASSSKSGNDNLITLQAR